MNASLVSLSGEESQKQETDREPTNIVKSLPGFGQKRLTDKE
jgi:hypothetical protein